MRRRTEYCGCCQKQVFKPQFNRFVAETFKTWPPGRPLPVFCGTLCMIEFIVKYKKWTMREAWDSYNAFTNN